MKRLVAALVVAAAFLAGATGSRAAFTGYFGGLRSELASRKANDYSGTLSKTQKNELKAIDKAIAAIDKPADDLGDDIKTAGAVAKGLATGFPEVFAPHLVVFPLTFYVDTLLLGLQGDLDGAVDDIGGSRARLSDKGKTKFDAAMNAVLSEQDDVPAAPDYAGWAAGLGKVHKAFLKAKKIVDTDKGPTATSSITVDGVAFKPSTLTVAYSELSGLLVLAAGKPGKPAQALSVTPASFHGTGSVAVSVGSWTLAQLPPKTYLLTNGGTFTVTALDTDANLVTFNFDFTAPGQLGAPGSVHVVGSYSGPYVSSD